MDRLRPHGHAELRRCCAEAAGTGKIVFIGKVANRNSGLIPIVVRLANLEERLRAEVPVKVRFQTEKGK